MFVSDATGVLSDNITYPRQATHGTYEALPKQAKTVSSLLYAIINRKLVLKSSLTDF